MSSARRPSTTPSLRPTCDDLDAPVAARLEGSDRRLPHGGVHREAVVVRGDLHAARGHVLHRLVDAAVAVIQLVGAVAEGAAEELVAEADPEVRDSPRPGPRAARSTSRSACSTGRRGRWRRTRRPGFSAVDVPRRTTVDGTTCTRAAARGQAVRGHAP